MRLSAAWMTVAAVRSRRQGVPCRREECRRAEWRREAAGAAMIAGSFGGSGAGGGIGGAGGMAASA